MRERGRQAKIKRPERARQRSPGLTNNRSVKENRPMADANSMGVPPIHSRGPDGRIRYDNPCPLCGKERLTRNGNVLGRPCRLCASKAASDIAAARSRPPSIHDLPLYKVFYGMRSRCECKGATGYWNYGARGIYVCEEWRYNPRAFMAWAEANGYAPGLEIDRIDNDGPYAPWNCQFLTHMENSRKRRSLVCDAQKARSVRDAIASGVTTRDAARAAGISEALAWGIKHGTVWKGV